VSYRTPRYTTPCTDDRDIISRLTDNKSHLYDLISGGASCSTSEKTVACPLRHIEYAAPGGNGSSPYYTGTKLPNAFRVLNNPSFYAWTPNAFYGARSGAHKIMVMFTDGQNEAYPTPFPEDVNTYDSLTRQRADETKKGPDGILGTTDDVEVYVIGYFCAPYDPVRQPPASFCKSRLADTALASRPCPGAWPPVGLTPSPVDQLLYDISSSSPNTCDHYFPSRNRKTCRSSCAPWPGASQEYD